MRIYHLESSQPDRSNFDNKMYHIGRATIEEYPNFEDATTDSPQDHFNALDLHFEQIPEETDIDLYDSIYVDDIEEAQARAQNAVTKGIYDAIADRVRDDLCQTKTGDTYALTVRQAGKWNGLDYGPVLIEIVVLDNDGDTIAYRYSDDSIDEQWEIGDVDHAVQAWFNAHAREQ